MPKCWYRSKESSYRIYRRGIETISRHLIELKGRLYVTRALGGIRLRFYDFSSQNNKFPLNKHTSFISIRMRFLIICLYRGSTVFFFFAFWLTIFFYYIVYDYRLLLAL
jgi:hypothetical protein